MSINNKEKLYDYHLMKDVYIIKQKKQNIYSVLTTLVSLSVLFTLDVLRDECFFFEQTTTMMIIIMIMNIKTITAITPNIRRLD